MTDGRSGLPIGFRLQEHQWKHGSWRLIFTDNSPGVSIDLGGVRSYTLRRQTYIISGFILTLTEITFSFRLTIKIILFNLI